MTLTSYGQGGGVETLANYLEDDWGDDALTGRTNPNTGVFREQLSGGVGDLLKAIYRPEWRTESGSPSALNQQLELPAGNSTTQTVSTPSSQAVGAWANDFQHVNNPTGGGVSFWMLSQGASATPSDSYFTIAVNAGSYDFRVRSGGTNTNLIQSTWPDDTATHTHKTTRDEDSNWELFLNGTSKGTATDSSYESGLYHHLRNAADVQVNLDNLNHS